MGGRQGVRRGGAWREEEVKHKGADGDCLITRGIGNGNEGEETG